MTEIAVIEPDELIADAETAKMLGVTAKTLAKWRSQDGGPPYIKTGRLVRYWRRDVTRFIAAHRRVPENSVEPAP